MKKLLAIAAATVSLSLFAGCGSSADSGSGSDDMHLTIGLGTASAIFAPAYIADHEGYFKKYGVDVKLVENTGSGTLNSVVSGDLDLANYGGPTPLLAALKGKQMSTVLNTHAGGVAGVMVGGKGITDVKQLDGKRVATFAEGSAAFGWTRYYEEKYGVKFDVVPMQDGPSIAAAVVSGNVDAGVGLYSLFSGPIAEGKATMLLDTRDPAERADLLGDLAAVPEGSLFGVTDNLKGKSDAAVAALKAWKDGREFYIKEAAADPESVAKILQSYPGFAGISLETLTNDVKALAPYSDVPDDGYISEDAWKSALGAYETWGLTGLTADNPKVSYDKAVDMSYLDTALGKK